MELDYVCFEFGVAIYWLFFYSFAIHSLSHTTQSFHFISATYPISWLPHPPLPSPNFKEALTPTHFLNADSMRRRVIAGSLVVHFLNATST
jgi:hypothetical protein